MSIHFSALMQRSRIWFLGSNLQWGISEYPKMQLKRDLIFGITDLLGKRLLNFIIVSIKIEHFLIIFAVYVGGMAGFFLGCSLLSFTELVYYLTWRFLRHLIAGEH